VGFVSGGVVEESALPSVGGTGGAVAVGIVRNGTISGGIGVGEVSTLAFSGVATGTLGY
jgi:hypothetical protein